MKKHLSTILLVLIFLVGLSIMLYPTVSDYINKMNASRVIADYNAALSEATPEDLTAWFAAADDYNRLLAGNPMVFFRPEIIEGYNDLLNVAGNGVMGYIDIVKGERVKIHLPIYHGVEDVILQVAAGHLPGTSLPVGGRSTHAVISGHTGLPSSRLFTDLDKLEIGDTFTITVLNQLLTYEIDQIKVVLPEETQDLQIVEGKDYCTLVTCTPYGVNSHRLLIRGVRTDNIVTDDDDEEVRVIVYVANEAFKIDSIVVAPIVAAPLLIIMLTVFGIGDRVRKKRAKARGEGSDVGNEAE